MTKQKKIAIVCNYALNPNRIGGMDRFYVAFDKRAKAICYNMSLVYFDFLCFMN